MTKRGVDDGARLVPFSHVPVFFFRARLPAPPKAPSWGLAMGRLDQTRHRRRRAARAIFVRSHRCFSLAAAGAPKAFSWGLAMGRLDQTRRRRRRAARSVFVRSHFFARASGGASHNPPCGTATWRLDAMRRRRRRAARHGARACVLPAAPRCAALLFRLRFLGFRF